MLCPHCGTYSDDQAIVCPECGRMLPRGENQDTGMQAIRQGRKARAAVAAGHSPESIEPFTRPMSRPDPASDDPPPVYPGPEVFDEQGQPFAAGSTYDRPRRTVYGDGPGREQVDPPKLRRDTHPVHHRQINWALFTVGAGIFAIVAVIGVALFLTRTPNGQRIMARFGMEADATALWEVGTERMDVGDIDGAIDYFLRAAELDGDDNVSVPGLLQLGGAYEAAGRLEDAEALYKRIYTDIVPSATDAYTNAIRILLSEDREAEAAVLMQLAYQKTGSVLFQNQRNQLLPQPPTVSPLAGYYEEVKTVSLISPQEYDIYYTFDEKAVLPADGVKYESPLRLDENTWPLRAVCVNDDLVSDEFSAVFRISMPSPGSPYASLAPNTYKQRQKLRIYQNIERTVDPNITIYYTIDGSTPNADSPIYKGEPFWLPGGRVTLKAVSVNEYGKASNMLEVLYKIETGPYPLSAYTVDDAANGLRLNTTLYSDFTAAYGEPSSTSEITRTGFEGTVRKCTYSWGYAVFHSYKGSQTLIELYSITDRFKGPRSTGIGDTLDKVVGKFRDMGQVESPSGNRGLYSTDNGTGRIYVNGNGTGRGDEAQIIYPDYPANAKVIRYTTDTADSHIWQLDYILVNNRVTALNMKYIP